ncbi:MAG TPA: SCO family protein [Anaeromyxobacter sp.]
MSRRLAALAAAVLSLPLAALAEGAPRKAAASPADRDAKARAYFTDTVLVDQEGQHRRFYEDVLRGNTVVISFLFTHCVDACPLIAQKLNGVARALGDAYGRDVKFVTISVDPENDTPAEMRKFLRKQGAKEPGWTFLSGKKADVHGVLKRLGQVVDDPSDHFTGFIAANVARGHWTKVRPDMPPEALAELMRNLLAEGGAVAAAAK